MSENATVTVGEREYVLRPFRGLKAITLMSAIGGLMKVMPDIQDQIAEVSKKHRSANMIEMDRAYFELRFPEEKVSEEAWASSSNTMRLPDPDAEIGWETILLSVLPTMMDEARDQVLNVLSLVVIPDADLQAADEADDVKSKLDVISKELLYNGTLEELAELAMKAVELVKGQFQGKVKELVEQVSEMFGPEEEDEEERTPMTVETLETPETPSETSSTPSPPPMDGPEEKSSAPDGMTSKATSTV